jgi:hypothetical protein
VYSSQRGRERPARARAALALSPSNVGEQLGLFFAYFAVKAFHDSGEVKPSTAKNAKKDRKGRKASQHERTIDWVGRLGKLNLLAYKS